DAIDLSPTWLEAVSSEATSTPRTGPSAPAPIDLGLPPCTASQDGFSLHADRVVLKNDRQGLEQLCRYGLRPAISAERLRATEDGRLAYPVTRSLAPAPSHPRPPRAGPLRAPCARAPGHAEFTAARRCASRWGRPRGGARCE